MELMGEFFEDIVDVEKNKSRGRERVSFENVV